MPRQRVSGEEPKDVVNTGMCGVPTTSARDKKAMRALLTAVGTRETCGPRSRWRWSYRKCRHLVRLCTDLGHLEIETTVDDPGPPRALDDEARGGSGTGRRDSGIRLRTIATSVILPGNEAARPERTLHRAAAERAPTLT